MHSSIDTSGDSPTNGQQPRTIGDQPRPGFWQQIRIDTWYLVTAFPLWIAGFVVSITLSSLGIGLTPIAVGPLVLVCAVQVARGLATIERGRIATVLGHPIPRPVHSTDTKASRRLLTPLADHQYWLDLLHALLNWIPATIGFCVAVTWWAGSLGGLTCYAWMHTIPFGETSRDLAYFAGFDNDLSSRITFYTALGAILCVTMPFVLRATAAANARFSASLIGARHHPENLY